MIFCNRTSQSLRRTPLGSALVCALLMTTGCDREKAEQPRPLQDSTEVFDLTFTPPRFSDDRKLDTILAVDLNGSGRLEYIVSSLGSGAYLPQGARADLVQIFNFDTVARRYQIASADSISWFGSFQLIDLTGDRNPEVISRIHSGGNDPVASEGMVIYSGDGGPLRPVFRARRGMPAFVRLPQSQAQGIVLHGELWPLFASHADVVTYVDDLVAWRDGRYQSVREERADFFMKLADSALQNYRRARADADSLPRLAARDSAAVAAYDSLATGIVDSSIYQREIELFNSAALSILYLQRANAARSLLSFWSSEKAFLARALPPAFHQELETIYTDGRRQADLP
jgi:hypothetical protein